MFYWAQAAPAFNGPRSPWWQLAVTDVLEGTTDGKRRHEA